MATKLLVYKDGELLAQVDVCTSPFRIGRGPENDIPLEDAQKRVSRTHAEIHVENDRFVLVDVSANGTFVGGRRISRQPIEHGMAFTVGPYRLVLDESTVSTAATVMIAVPGEFATEADVSSTFPPVADVHAGPSRPAASAAKKAPSTATSRHQRGETTRLYVKRYWKEFTAAGLTIVLGVAVAVIVGSSDSVRDRRQQHLDAARALLERGGTADEIVANAQSALQQHIALVLAASPSDEDALVLQGIANARAVAPPPPPIAPPAPATTADDLAEARAFRDQKAWPQALAAVQQVLDRDPADADALALRDEITRLSKKPAPPAPPRATSLTADPLSFPWSSETAPAYAERLARVRRLLADARAELGRRNPDAARSIVKDLDADTRAGDQARREGDAIRNEIENALARQRELQEALDRAQRDEAAGELQRAYDTLVTLRNSGSAVPDLDDRILAVSRKMAREGEAAMKTLRSAINANDTAAKSRACKRALEFLPADHADRRTAESLCR